MLFGHQANNTTDTPKPQDNLAPEPTTVAPTMDAVLPGQDGGMPSMPPTPPAPEPPTNDDNQQGSDDVPAPPEPDDTLEHFEDTPSTPPAPPELPEHTEDEPNAPEYGATPAPSMPGSDDEEASDDKPKEEDAPSDTPAPSDGSDDDLVSLKQNALDQLTPLVDHLDQSPEEKFRTTMMMIQSTDNQALLKDAYAAAQAISDDKARAQALLDIINEINYFTQQKDK